MSQDFLISRFYASEPTSGRVVDDTPVGLRITNVSDAAVTSVTVTTATNIVLIDADGTTTVTFATYPTLGAVADVINGTSNWRCKLLDALRADDSTASPLVTGAITATVVNGETVYDALVDTSTAVALTYRATYDRTVADARPLGNHRVNVTRFTYNVNVSAAEAGAVRIYKFDKANNTETLIWSATSVDGAGSTANDTTHTFAQGLSSGDNNDLVVRIFDTTSVTDNGANFMNVEFTRE